MSLITRAEAAGADSVICSMIVQGVETRCSVPREEAAIATPSVTYDVYAIR